MIIGVTGATGTLGLKFLALLHSAGHRVRVLSRNRPTLDGMDNEWCAFDLADATEIMAPKLQGLEQIVHLAAKVPDKIASPGIEQSYWDLNVLGTQRLIEAMAQAQVGKLIVAGAANAYAPEYGEAFETSAFGPRARVLYLASKVVQEWHAASLCSALSVGCTILRISSVIGDGKSVIDILAQKLANGDNVSIAGGDVFGADFVDCEDVCRGLLLVVEKRLSGVYNLSSGQRTTLRDAITEIGRVLGCSADKVQRVEAGKNLDRGFPAVNCDRLRDCGYTPSLPAETLRRIALNAQINMSK
jgi:nucleoside-diphosphate-sugar epimerase